MLREIIINNKHVTALIHEVLTHCTARVRRNVLEGRCLRSARGYNDRVIHGAVFLKVFNKARNSRSLLADSHVDTDYVLAFLIYDGIRCNGRLSGLAVADDKLTLSPSDGDHGIDGLDARLKGLKYGLPLADTGCGALDGTEFFRHDGTRSVDGLTKGINNTPDHGVTYGNRHNLTGTVNGLAFTDLLVGTEEHDRNAVLFKVLSHTEASVLELDQLARHAVDKTGCPGDTVTYVEDGSGFVLLNGILVVFDLAADDFGYFFGF